MVEKENNLKERVKVNFNNFKKNLNENLNEDFSKIKLLLTPIFLTIIFIIMIWSYIIIESQIINTFEDTNIEIGIIGMSQEQKDNFCLSKFGVKYDIIPEYKNERLFCSHSLSSEQKLIEENKFTKEEIKIYLKEEKYTEKEEITTFKHLIDIVLTIIIMLLIFSLPLQIILNNEKSKSEYKEIKGIIVTFIALFTFWIFNKFTFFILEQFDNFIVQKNLLNLISTKYPFIFLILDNFSYIFLLLLLVCIPLYFFRE